MSNLEKAYLEEIDFVIDTELEDDFMAEEDKEVLKSITKKRKKEIVEQLIEDNEINETVYNAVKYYLFH